MLLEKAIEMTYFSKTERVNDIRQQRHHIDNALGLALPTLMKKILIKKQVKTQKEGN